MQTFQKKCNEQQKHSMTFSGLHLLYKAAWWFCFATKWNYMNEHIRHCFYNTSASRVVTDVCEDSDGNIYFLQTELQNKCLFRK